MKKQLKRRQVAKLNFDDHRPLSKMAVRGALEYFNLAEDDFFNWMNGQTCPLLPNGQAGVFWYDLNRYIQWKLNNIVPEFD